LKLATWNVNSLKVRLPQVLDWAGRHRPDVLCLQETKIENEKFPVAEIRAAGYEPLVNGQKTYNGVAILSLASAVETIDEIPRFEDNQKRVLAATISGIRIVDAYVPNGENVESEKYQYKLKWLRAFRDWLREELARHPRLAVVGDFNVAPEPRDVYDPKMWEGQVLFSEPERDAFAALVGLGLKDAFRLFEQPEKIYSWWDYRMLGFRRNAGLRIDQILVSEQLASACTGCAVDKEPRKLERPSDHAPVVAVFA